MSEDYPPPPIKKLFFRFRMALFFNCPNIFSFLTELILFLLLHSFYFFAHIGRYINLLINSFVSPCTGCCAYIVSWLLMLCPVPRHLAAVCDEGCAQGRCLCPHIQVSIHWSTLRAEDILSVSIDRMVILVCLLRAGRLANPDLVGSELLPDLEMEFFLSNKNPDHNLTRQLYGKHL